MGPPGAPPPPPPLLLPLLLLPLLLLAPCCQAVGSQPEQIHLSFTRDITAVTVTYSTADEWETVVRYGRAQLDSQNTGFSTLFVQGADQHQQYIHRVNLTGLEPGEQYSYQVSGPQGWSDVFQFSAMKPGTDWSPRLAIYGDLGTVNGRSLPQLEEDTQKGLYDAVLHVGDFAYNMDSDQGEVGDLFMRQIQPIAACLPYMTCPGNHEQAGNFSNYKNRFSMPGDAESMFFSFDMGPVHFVAVSSEFYYYTNYGYEQAVNQINWMKADLQMASEPSARAQRPWIVVYGHRPMYCTNLDQDDCTKAHDLLRVGIPEHNIPGMEDLLMEYGVDLAIWAHEHSYERLWPIYNYTIYKGPPDQPYLNPGAPVHITTGSAGCDENHNPFWPFRAPWSAFRSIHYGYTRMTFHNGSHMSMEQISVDGEGGVIDSIEVVKEVHRPFSQLTQTPRGYL